MKLPLEGIRVLDWTTFLQGPIATVMLGDLGADVIKIEQRAVGDHGRGLKTEQGTGRDLCLGADRSWFFESNNRNKRGIAIDLKKEEGREIVYRLVRDADVFVQNFRQGVAKRLGVDYETLASRNPKLIYANSSGFGPKGPASHEPAYDHMAQARSGFMTQAGDPGMPPFSIGWGLADQTAGILTAYGILAALVERNRSGVGQELDVSLLGSMIWLQQMNVNASVMLGHELARLPRSRAGNPLANHYLCANDRWISLGMIQADRYWSDFCKVVGIEELENDPRFENIAVRGEHGAELVAILDRVFASATSEEWISQLRAVDLLVAPVNTISDLANDPQVLANDYITEFDHPALGRKLKMVGIPVRFRRTPGCLRRPAPEFGEHTEEVLVEAGYSWDDISGLREREVI